MKRFTNVMLFIIMILLIGAIAVFGISIYANMTNTEISNTIYTINTIVTSDDLTEQETVTAITNEEISEEINVNVVEIQTNTNEGYFYQQLTKNQKIIYDGLQKNKENMRNGTYTIEYGARFSDVLNEENGKRKLGDDYQAAVETFLYDNPDVFYINANKLYLNIETSKTVFKTTHNVSIGPANNDTYYADGFTSEAQVKAASEKMENIRENVLSNLTGNTYKKILRIHDYLVESIEYDSNFESIGTYGIYGALIEKKCVCEGYAKALKYLLDGANIPCVMVKGVATNSSEETESHAWNCVNLDGKWYYIDSTWNDPIIIGNGTIAKSIQYRYFLKGERTLNKDHTPTYQFSTGGRTYTYPTAEQRDYE